MLKIPLNQEWYLVEMKWKIMLTYGLKYNFFVIGQKWTIIYWLDSFYEKYE